MSSKKPVRKPAGRKGEPHTASMMAESQLHRKQALTNVISHPSSQTLLPRALERINEQEELDAKMSVKAAAVATRYESARASQVFKLQRIWDLLGEQAEGVQNYGHLHALGGGFWSTQQQLHRNYKLLVKQYSSLLQNGDTQYAVDLKRVLNSYQLLRNEAARRDYLHALKVRCHLTQPRTLEDLTITPSSPTKSPPGGGDLDEHYESIFPFFIFPILLKTSKGEPQERLLEIDFVERRITEINSKTGASKSTHFRALAKVIPAHRMDDFVLELESRVLELRAAVPLQRDLMVKVLRLAIEDYYENQKAPIVQKKSLKLRKLSPRTTSKDSLASKTSLVAPCQSGLKLLRDDFVMPPRSLLHSELKTDSVQDPLYVLLGASQLLISRDPEAREVVSVLPLLSEEQGGAVVHSQEELVVSKMGSVLVRLHASSEVEAGFIYQKLREVLTGSVQRKRYKDMLSKREALQDSPAVKVEQLAILEQECADVRRRLELLLIKRNELRRELRHKGEDSYPPTDPEGDSMRRLDTINRSEQAHYGLDLLSPKTGIKQEAEIVLSQNTYGEQLVIQRETMQQMKHAFSQVTPPRVKSKTHDLTFSA